MGTILQQPDTFSFSGNLKSFEVSSNSEVDFELWKGSALILKEKYQPSGGAVSISMKAIIEKLLMVNFPISPITIQDNAIGDFTAIIDGEAVNFRAIKGGVAELSGTAAAFVGSHFLSWQPQEKTVTQNQPEYATFYATMDCLIKCIAYLVDGTMETTYFDLVQGSVTNQLVTIDVSWSTVRAFSSGNVFAWDICLVNLADAPLTPVQRYRLRNSGVDEHPFLWANTLGGTDSVSFTGKSENDRKLEHLVAQLCDGSFGEYQVNKNAEIKQSTGYLTLRESLWIEDFFYSKQRYKVMPDGSVRQIVILGSKVQTSTVDDLFEFEFSYRFASDTQLLNLDQNFEDLPVPEGPGDFFLTELLSSLTTAQYSDNLLVAVQNPLASGWMKLALSQLWSSALPSLVDGTSITVVDGKLRANTANVAGAGTYGSTVKHAIITVDGSGRITKIEEAYSALHKEQLMGAVNGTNKTFNTSVAYAPGSVILFVNGLKERGYTETGTTEVTMDEAPLNRGFSDIVEAIFIKQ